MAPPRNRRPGFSRRAQYGHFLSYVLAGGGVLVAVVLLLLANLNPPAFAALRGGFSEVVTPVASGADWLRRGVSGIPAGIGSFFGVRSENARLRAELAARKAQIAEAQVITRDNRRLRAMLRLRERVSDPIVSARIVYATGSSTRRFATLNAGRWQGVQPGQPVRGADGLIGRVVETSPNTARILLVLDPESVVPVRRIRDGLPAIAAGRGDGLIDIRSAGEAQAQFNVGDGFVTSGTGGLFPPNIAVAVITESGRDVAKARPTASPDTLDYALVQRAFFPEASAVRAPDMAPR